MTDQIDRNSTAYAALVTRNNKLEERVSGLESVFQDAVRVIGELQDRIESLEETPTAKRRKHDAVSEKIFEFLKETKLKFNAVAVAQNLGMDRSIASSKLQSLHRSGRIQFDRVDGQQGCYYYKEEGET
jgi:hypothetical protein